MKGSITAIAPSIALTLTRCLALTLKLTLCLTLSLSHFNAVFAQESPWEENSVKVNSGEPKYKATVKKMEHEYGPWSISTNITALVPYQPLNNRITVEPEYQFNDRVSLKMPIMIGLIRSFRLNERMTYYGDMGWGLYNNDNFESNTVPSIRNKPSIWYTDDIIAQVGLNPKYYFNKKSKSLFSWYGSVALNAGLADQYSLHGYDRLDTVSDIYYDFDLQEYATGWVAEEREVEYHSDEFFYINCELLVGIDYNFSRKLTCTFETGYASPLILRPAERNDRIYTAIYDQDYVLNFEGSIRTTGRKSAPIRTRLLLTYRF